MTLDYIRRAIKALTRKYKETDPVCLCEDAGISIMYLPMGSVVDACKGFLLVSDRIATIVVNSEIPEYLQRVVIAHELGHVILHRDLVPLKMFHEYQLFDQSLIQEYEANMFAAGLLLSDEDVLEAIQRDLSLEQIAALLRVPPQLLEYKLRLMRSAGYKNLVIPTNANGDFLKRLPSNTDSRSSRSASSSNI